MYSDTEYSLTIFYILWACIFNVEVLSQAKGPVQILNFKVVVGKPERFPQKTGVHETSAEAE